LKELRETANDRQIAILELLKSGPKKGSDLCRQYMEANRSDALNDDHLLEYVPVLLEGLEGKGWVQRAKSYGNRVWYIITEEGFREMLRSRDPKKLRRMQQSKLRRALLTVSSIEGRRIDWRDSSNYTEGLRERLEEGRRKIADISKALPAKDVERVKGQVLAVLMAENRMPNRKTEGRARLIEDMARGLPADTVQRAQRAAERRLRLYHEKEGIILDGNGLPVVYGKCFFCGADIVAKEAAEDAKLLAVYGGKKGEMVCCGCFAHMEWMEKNFGGEQVGKSIQS
jgi:hypothetical protein